MRYLCTNCNYIFDESIGEKDEGILPGVRFETLQDTFVCPVCAESHDMFHEITEEINTPINPSNLTPIEKEHQIFYEIDREKIHIGVGQDEPHPMIEDHFIASISLFDETGQMIDESFTSILDTPETDFDLDYIETFEIRIRCSVHGVWSSGMINIDN